MSSTFGGTTNVVVGGLSGGGSSTSQLQRPASAAALGRGGGASSSSSGPSAAARRNRELEKRLTKMLKRDGATASLVTLSSWLYQRALLRYRQHNFLGASRDCERVVERCCGCAHARILFLNAKALKRLGKLRESGVSLYRACVEAAHTRFLQMFAPAAALLASTPVCAETEESYTGILLLLQRNTSALLALLTAPCGVELFWHLVVEEKGFIPKGMFSTEFGQRWNAEWLAKGAPPFLLTGGDGGGDDGGGDRFVTDLDEGLRLQAEDLAPAGGGGGGKHGSMGKSRSKSSGGGETSDGGAGGGAGAGGSERSASTANQKKPKVKRSKSNLGRSDVGVAGGVPGSKDGKSSGSEAGVLRARTVSGESAGAISGEDHGDDHKPPAGARPMQFLEALGLKTLVVAGLTALRQDGWVDLFDGPLFMSFLRFVTPDVNLHLSFTTITLYAELMHSHPHLVSFEPLFPKVMECFLSERDELLHACGRFLIEAFAHHADKLRVQILPFFVDFLAQKPSKLRAFVLAYLLPVLAHATSAGVANPKSVIDELSAGEKTSLLKYLAICVSQCLEDESSWGMVKKNVTGWLFLFASASDPEEETRLLAQYVDGEKLTKYILQSSSYNSCLKSLTGIVFVRRLLSLGWLFDGMLAQRGVTKVVSELEQLHEISSSRRRLGCKYEAVVDEQLRAGGGGGGSAVGSGSGTTRGREQQGVSVYSAAARSRSPSPEYYGRVPAVVDSAETLSSALLRLLGFLLLRRPNLRFGKEHEDETETEASQREGAEEDLQKSLRGQFLERVGVFPTFHDQWILSLRPAVQVGSSKRFDFLSNEDLQRICRGHRLAGVFKDFFRKSEGIMSPGFSPVKLRQMPGFDQTMALSERRNMNFDGGAIEKSLKRAAGGSGGSRTGGENMMGSSSGAGGFSGGTLMMNTGGGGSTQQMHRTPKKGSSASPQKKTQVLHGSSSRSVR